MTGYVLLAMGILLPIVAAVFYLLGRHHRRPFGVPELSAVSRQHIDLFQGGQLNEAAVEAAKSRFRDLLERGDAETVENSLRAGLQYVVQVRALAELGTDDAGRILERQLHRRLTDDPIEQSWYWIDLAHGLRSLNRSESLPHLLRCAEKAAELPLGHFYAAETVCFLGFAGYLRHPETPLGQAALRVLHRALEGLRSGVQPGLVSEARLGEIIEDLWDHRGEATDPLLVRVLVETERLLRRAPHAETSFEGEVAEEEAFSWQMARIAALEPTLIDYLHEIHGPLVQRLVQLPPTEHRDTLLALADLRADVGLALLPLLRRPHPELDLVLEVLAHSHDPAVGAALRDWTTRRLSLIRRSQVRRRAFPPRRPSVPADLPYRGILRALRSQPSEPTESVLLLAARDWDPTYRAAAVSSLGWWEPMQRPQVLLTLQDCRRDPNPEVRQAARAALARLGERHALQWFRQCLTSEDAHRVHDTIQTIALENLTLLWPDLDRLADSEDSDVAHFAREALERMAEDLDRERR